MTSKFLAWIVSLTLTLNSYLVWAAAPDIVPEEVEPAEVIARLDDLLRSFDQLRAEVDRSQFDLEALVERLDYDADEIVRFVSEDIYFEQYPGVLRGAKGTLMSRSGNALDQAVLLSTLLKDAGFDARIVRGEINAADAHALLSRMKTPGYLSPFRDADAFAQIVKQFDPSGSGLSADEVLQSLLDTGEHQQQAIRDEYAADARRISTRLLKEIRDARGVESWEDSLPMAETRDYFWVQSRLDTNNWIDLHPAWADARMGPSSATVNSTYADTVPTDLVQKVELLLTGERVIGRKRENITLLKMDPTPAANLISFPLSLTFAPLGDYETLEEFADVLPKAELFVPLLNERSSAFVIDLQGYFVPAAEAQNAMAGVFREVGQAVSGAAGALGSLESPADEVPKSVTALTGLWVDFRIHLPDGQVREHRRTIIDGISGSRNNDQWSLEGHSIDELREMILGTRHTLLETGHSSTAFQLEETLSYAHKLTKFYKDWFGQKAGIAGASEPEPPPIAPPSMHLALFDVFDQINAGDPSAVMYRSEPSLVTIEFKGRTSEGGEVTAQTTVDVVSNERRVFVKHGKEYVPSGDDAVYLGVMETLAEGSILPEGSGSGRSAGEATLSALAANRAFTVLKPESREAIAKLPVSPISARAMHRELDQGYWLIAPELADDANQEDHIWWRIHPETGNALGMLHTGQGGLVMASFAEDLAARIFYFGVFYGKVVMPFCAAQQSSACLTAGVGAAGVFATAGTVGLAVGVLAFGAFLVALILAAIIRGLGQLLYARSQSASRFPNQASG